MLLGVMPLLLLLLYTGTSLSYLGLFITLRLMALGVMVTEVISTAGFVVT